MRLLAIDTTGEFCSAALRQPGAADIIASDRIGRGHAERLAPMVDTLLREAGCAPGDLDRIGVTTGPGSFAGVRVGVAFIRGLALATGAEAVGISTLSVWANTGALKQVDDVWTVHDARRGDVVLQHFSKGLASGVPSVLPVETAAHQLHQWQCDGAATPMRGLTLTGTGLPAVASAMPALVKDQGEADAATDCVPLDLAVLLDLTAAAPPPTSPPSPFYARPPDAKLPGGTSL
tara:strand:+ start:2366 stop:3067 length:702 start_codon:yes stop_codon:yes gene_type:complete